MFQFHSLEVRFRDPWLMLGRFNDRSPNPKLRLARRRKRRPAVPRGASNTKADLATSLANLARRREITRTPKPLVPTNMILNN
jgi:hypothetical protein